MSASFGRIGGVIGPYLVGILLASGVSLVTVFSIFFIAILIGAFAVLFLGTETKGKELT
ncbi:putative niacin/nicotinamide transporter NaiP [compost metagenome]